MAYLTSDEFKKLGYSPPDSGFEETEQAAEHILNAITSYYDPVFGKHDLEHDLNSDIALVANRAKRFQQCVAIQTQLLLDTGAKSAYDLSKNNLTSYTVDETEMTFKDGALDSLTKGSTGVSNAVYGMLGQLGLLYAGVDHS